MRVLIIRHGQTDWNVKRLLQGTMDIELNETGISQAVEARKEIQDINIDLVVCSPLKRTKKTAELLLNGRDIPIIYDDRIVERRFGVAEGKTFEEIDFDNTWTFGEPPMFEGMETIEMLIERVGSLFDELYEKYRDKTILVVTHGGTSIAIGYYFKGVPKHRNEYFCKNCVIKEYTK